MSEHIALVGALDTKSEDLAFVKEYIESREIETVVIDIGVLGEPGFTPDIRNDKVSSAGGKSIEELRDNEDKTESMEVMYRGLTEIVPDLYEQGRLQGIFSMGGSNATEIATAAMRELPLGVPKVMVSTMAGGDVSEYVDIHDVVMFPSVADVAGVNKITRPIYTNAAGAICGMVQAEAPTSEKDDRPIIAASMFGNTTQSVQQCKEILAGKDYETTAFHAVGTGGRTIDKLGAEGYFAGILDITTTEIADEVCGGVFSAGSDRLVSALRKGVPTMVAPGCVDMANFGSRETVPEKYQDRKLYEWNPQVTLMRTNREENMKIGKMLASNINQAGGPVSVLLPLQGVSMLDSKGKDFWAPEIDRACFEALRENLDEDVPVYEVDCNINQRKFSQRATELILDMLRSS